MSTEVVSTEVGGNINPNLEASRRPLNKKGKGKSWFLTINNWTIEEKAFAEALPCQRKIIAEELAPTTGTPHIHIAIIFKSSKRWAAMKKLFPRADVRQMRGRWSDQEYLLKEGNAYIEDNTKQGQRTDIELFVKDAQVETEQKILEVHPGAWCKYQRAYSRLKEMKEKKASRAFRHLNVIVHWGYTGTWKTRIAYDLGGHIWKPSAPEWWNGYEGEEIIIIDEFYGQMRAARFLSLLDGYQCRLPTKGGFTYARWTTVYITSNVHPDDWYAGKIPESVKQAMMRRIKKVVYFPKVSRGL